MSNEYKPIEYPTMPTRSVNSRFGSGLDRLLTGFGYGQKMLGQEREVMAENASQDAVDQVLAKNYDGNADPLARTTALLRASKYGSAELQKSVGQEIQADDTRRQLARQAKLDKIAADELLYQHQQDDAKWAMEGEKFRSQLEQNEMDNNFKTAQLSQDYAKHIDDVAFNEKQLKEKNKQFWAGHNLELSKINKENEKLALQTSLFNNTLASLGMGGSQSSNIPVSQKSNVVTDMAKNPNAFVGADKTTNANNLLTLQTAFKDNESKINKLLFKPKRTNVENAELEKLKENKTNLTNAMSSVSKAQKSVSILTGNPDNINKLIASSDTSEEAIKQIDQLIAVAPNDIIKSNLLMLKNKAQTDLAGFKKEVEANEYQNKVKNTLSSLGLGYSSDSTHSDSYDAKDAIDEIKEKITEAKYGNRGNTNVVNLQGIYYDPKYKDTTKKGLGWSKTTGAGTNKLFFNADTLEYNINNLETLLTYKNALKNGGGKVSFSVQEKNAMDKLEKDVKKSFKELGLINLYNASMKGDENRYNALGGNINYLFGGQSAKQKFYSSGAE